MKISFTLLASVLAAAGLIQQQDDTNVKEALAKSLSFAAKAGFHASKSRLVSVRPSILNPIHKDIRFTVYRDKDVEFGCMVTYSESIRAVSRFRNEYILSSEGALAPLDPTLLSPGARSSLQTDAKSMAREIVRGLDLAVHSVQIVAASERSYAPISSVIVSCRRKLGPYFLIDCQDGARCTFSIRSGVLYEYFYDKRTSVIVGKPQISRESARAKAMRYWDEADSARDKDSGRFPELGKNNSPSRMMLAYAVPNRLFTEKDPVQGTSGKAQLVWAARYGAFHMYISAETGALLGGGVIDE